MQEFDPVASWFDEPFRIKKQKSVKVKEGGRRTGGGGHRGVSRAGKAKNIQAVIRKAPEVMVKITGSDKGMASVRHHLEYISRNGQVDLQDENGQILRGMDDVKGLQRQLAATDIPAESHKREFLHVVFSMPPGTPPRAVANAVAGLCNEEFGRHHYVMAQHHDTDHSHVHVCVATRDKEVASAPDLNPDRTDLFRWRQVFADKLRNEGVEAAASKRWHRFNHQKQEKSPVRQMRMDHPASTRYRPDREAAKATARLEKALARPEQAFTGPPRPARVPAVWQRLSAETTAAVARGQRPVNPAQSALERQRDTAYRKWSEVADNLTRSGQHALAADVHVLLEAGKATPVSLEQMLYDQAVQAAQARQTGTTSSLPSPRAPRQSNAGGHEL